MDDRLLSVDGLTLDFETYEGTVNALNDVTFHLKKGEWYGLVGETGSGKTVTSLSILRLLPASAKVIGGQIVFNGIDLLKLSENEMRQKRSTMPMIFQDPGSSLNPSMRVGAQIAETIALHHKVRRKEALVLSIGLLEQVGITNPQECHRYYPHELSGGVEKSLVIALALACKPELLIADEPTINLDVTIQAEIMELLGELQKKLNMTILLITHNLGLVATLCSRVAVMYAGTIVEQGSTANVLNNSLHPYTRALIRAIPTIKAKRAWLDNIPGTVPDMSVARKGCLFQPRCGDYIKGKCELESPLTIEYGSEHFVACHLFGRSEVIS